MKKLRFLDETLRDGQQALWATRMRTSAMLPIAPVMDRAGFYQVCAMAPVSFETAAMYLHEDPWERLRLLRRHMPHTQLDFLVRSRNVVGWQRQPNDVVELFLKTLRRIGIDSVKVFDGLNDFRNVAWHVKVAKSLGFQVKALLSFCVSPVHTDAYLAGKAGELRDLGIDAVVQSDAAGVMPPDRVRTIIPALRASVGDEVELQFSAHATTGLAGDCYREAIRQGIDVVWTASRPLAYRSSIPATLDILRIAREEGRDTDLDERSVREIDDWFRWVAYREQRPIPEPVRFDPDFYRRYAGHQIPGGMISNLVSQLRGMGIENRLDEVLEEASRVRAELGYPVMVTPFSQFVGVQATLNVVQGRRYDTVPEGIRLYARGYYGRPVAPLDPDVLDRLMGDDPPIDPMEGMDEPVLPKIRAEHGPFASDEELLLFLFLNPAALSDFHRNRRPVVWEPVRSPLRALVEALAHRRDIASIEVRHGGLKFALARACSAPGSEPAGGGGTGGADRGGRTDAGPAAFPGPRPAATTPPAPQATPRSIGEPSHAATASGPGFPPSRPAGLDVTPSDAARLLDMAGELHVARLRLSAGGVRLTAKLRGECPEVSHSPKFSGTRPAGAQPAEAGPGPERLVTGRPEGLATEPAGGARGVPAPAGRSRPGDSAEPGPPGPGPAEPRPPGPGPALARGLLAVASPRVGTFRRAPRPLERPCVEVGDLVTEDSAVGVVETVEGETVVSAGARGRVAAVYADDGAFVEYGQRLLLLAPP